MGVTDSAMYMNMTALDRSHVKQIEMRLAIYIDQE